MFLVVLFSYLPSLWYNFVWDDLTAITTNTSIREWKNIPQFFTDPYTFGHDPKHENAPEWRPVRNIYYLLTYKTHGLHPAGWHLHHIILFSVVAVVILVAFHRLIRYHINTKPDSYLPLSLQLSTWLAVFCWSVHPANTEVTAWLKSADDLLSVLFTSLALAILFPVDSTLSIRRGLIASLLFALALLAKASIAPFPAIYVALAIILSPNWTKTVQKTPFLFSTLLLFVTLAIFIKLRLVILGKLEQVDYMTGSFSTMMATMTTAGVRYLHLTFWPFWPTVQIGDYIGWPAAQSWNEPRVFQSIFILCIFTVFAIVISWRRPVIKAGFIWMGLAYAPVANVIPMMQIMAERFMFFPLIGVALSAVWIINGWLVPNIKRRIWLPTLLAIALLVTTETRMPRFVDNANFQADSAKALPVNARALYNHGIELYFDGQTTAAIQYLTKSMSLYPTPAAGMATTMALLDAKQTSSAMTFLNQMNRDFPREPRPFALKADLLRIGGNHKEAIDNYTSAILLENKAPTLYYYRALSLIKERQTSTAITDLRKALVLDENYTSAIEMLEILTTSSASKSIPTD